LPLSVRTAAFVPTSWSDSAGRRSARGMGIFDFITNGVRELTIARPDDKKHLIVFKHPDKSIPSYAQLTVDADEAAVFVRDGAVVGVLRTLGVGERHTLDTENVPFLDQILDKFTGANVFTTDLYFITLRPTYDQQFGGELGLIEDPLLGEMITPRIYGTFSFQISDPVAFLLQYLGLKQAGSNEDVLRWIKGLLLNSIRTVMGQVLVEQQTSMLQLMAMQQTLALRFAQNAPDLQEIGCRILGMGQFQVNISDDDKARLTEAQSEIGSAKRAARVANIGIAQAAAEAQQRQFELDQRFNQDARYTRDLAGGSFTNYASGQAMLGAGQGLAKGDGDSAAGTAASLGVGFALANQLARTSAAPGPASVPPTISTVPSAPSSAGTTCPSCRASVQPGKFCSECGASLAPVKRVCAACGVDGAPGARFCASCGTAYPQPA
jgi:membrane protease subunit (stomatin/prohibitin family)